MHFDESMGSSAGSDLEDGEIRKLLTSSLYAQSASGDQMQWSFRKVRQVHKRPTHQKAGELPGDRLHCFHQDVINRETKCGVLFLENANPSNFNGTLLEGNKDHLLNQTKSDLARKESHVESLNKCIDDSQKRTEVQDRALQEVQNEFVESRREQARLREELIRKENALRDTQIRSMHDLEKIKRAQLQQVDEMSIQKFYSTAHFTNAAIARTDEFHEQFWRIPGY